MIGSLVHSGAMPCLGPSCRRAALHSGHLSYQAAASRFEYWLLCTGTSLIQCLGCRTICSSSPTQGLGPDTVHTVFMYSLHTGCLPSLWLYLTSRAVSTL